MAERFCPFARTCLDSEQCDIQDDCEASLMTERGTVAERVAKGADWLDAREMDWRSRIDLDKLDISNGLYCILGQVFGYQEVDGNAYNGFEYVTDILGLSTRQVEDYGFDAYGDLGLSSLSADYRALKEEWKTVLLAPEPQNVWADQWNEEGGIS